VSGFGFYNPKPVQIIKSEPAINLLKKGCTRIANSGKSSSLRGIIPEKFLASIEEFDITFNSSASVACEHEMLRHIGKLRVYTTLIEYTLIRFTSDQLLW
jgi:hypothetical protein